MEYDYSKLRGKIVEVFGSQAKFAKALGVSDRTVSLKLNNERGWTQEEINKSMKLFDEPSGKIKDYFFTLKVQ